MAGSVAHRPILSRIFKSFVKYQQNQVEFFRKIELYNARKTRSMNTHYCKWSKQNQMNATSHDYVYDITVNDRFNH